MKGKFRLHREQLFRQGTCLATAVTLVLPRVPTKPTSLHTEYVNLSRRHLFSFFLEQATTALNAGLDLQSLMAD